MTQIENTIEDYLELLAGFKNYSCGVSMDPTDRTILYSMARQVFKRVSLTDRQYTVAVEKLLTYREEFEKNGFVNFEEALGSLRQPLREIDRSKTISIETEIPEPTLFSDVKKYIRIRFPFNKKLIVLVEKISRKYPKKYFHKKGTHEHYFVHSENVSYDIVSEFKDRNFDIDPELLNFADQVSEMMSDHKKFLPCIYQGKTYNLKPSVEESIFSTIENDQKKLIDRHRRYGLINYDTYPGNSVESLVVNRDSVDFLANPSKYSTSELLNVIHQLDRYPLLVLLNERTADEEIFSIWETVRTYIDNEEQSVLFRQEGDTDFNRFVKDKKLNNWVDSKTKIVYISNDKLPKPLVSSEFRPITAFLFANRGINRFVDAYIQSHCDLVVNYDEQESLMRKHSSYYSW